LVDETVAIISGIVAGLAGGFLSSWMGFNSSGEKFDVRKHGNALITGALSGVALALGLVHGSQVPAEQLTAGQYIFGVFLIFLSAVGIDKLRSNTSQMVTGIKSLKSKSTTTTTTGTTATPAAPNTSAPPSSTSPTPESTKPS
jgi:drug/metabolite transporter (DMT)-like permease